VMRLISAMASAATAMLVSRATCAGEAVSALPAAMSDADADAGASAEVDAIRASAGAEVTVIDVDGVGASAIGVRVGGTEKAEKLASSGAYPRQRACRRGEPRTIGSGVDSAMAASVQQSHAPPHVD